MPSGNKRQLSTTAITYIAVGVAMITIMTIIGMSAFMQLRVIVIEGVPQHTVDEIVEASGLSIGDNLFFVSPHNISRNIQEALPFVISAQVARVPPDTISINITTSRPVAAITSSGEVYIIDSSGRVLETARVGAPLLSDVNINDLIEIHGVDVDVSNTIAGGHIRPVFGTETRLQHMLDILEILDSEMFTEIEESEDGEEVLISTPLIDFTSYIDVSNIVNVHFGFMDIYRVTLGGGINLRYSNLRHSISGLPEYVDQVQSSFPNSPGNIDMSSETGGPIFRRAD